MSAESRCALSWDHLGWMLLARLKVVTHHLPWLDDCKIIIVQHSQGSLADGVTDLRCCAVPFPAQKSTKMFKSLLQEYNGRKADLRRQSGENPSCRSIVGTQRSAPCFLSGL